MLILLANTSPHNFNASAGGTYASVLAYGLIVVYSLYSLKLRCVCFTRTVNYKLSCVDEQICYNTSRGCVGLGLGLATECHNKVRRTNLRRLRTTCCFWYVLSTATMTLKYLDLLVVMHLLTQKRKDRKILSIRKEPMLSGSLFFSQEMNAFFHFPLFSPHNI